LEVPTVHRCMERFYQRKRWYSSWLCTGMGSTANALWL